MICFNKTKRELKWLNVEKKQKVRRKKLKKEEKDKLRLFKNCALLNLQEGVFYFVSGISAGTSIRFKALSILIFAFSPKTTSNSDFNLS